MDSPGKIAKLYQRNESRNVSTLLLALSAMSKRREQERRNSEKKNWMELPRINDLDGKVSRVESSHLEKDVGGREKNVTLNVTPSERNALSAKSA